MTAGIQVIGDHGSTQIDENYFNIVLIASGVSTTQTGQTISTNEFGTTIASFITVTGVAPVICMDTRGANLTVWCIQTSGNQFTFTIISASQPATFSYYIYDVMPNIQASNQGLTVWNSNGKVTFNSDYEPLRIINMAQIPDDWTTISGQTLNDPPTYVLPAATTLYGTAGQKVAAFISREKRITTGINQSYTGVQNQGFITNNTSNPPYATTEGNTNYVQVGSFGWGGGAPNQRWGGQFALVDVTNHWISP